MKVFNKVGLQILFWAAIPLIILYFKWAAQEITSLPGLATAEPESYISIIKTNSDVIVVSLITSIPAYYWSLFCLTPKLLFNTNVFNLMLYASGLTLYYVVARLITKLIFPMYFFFGTPFSVKVLAPVIMISALSGTLFAFMRKLQEKKL